MGEDLLDVLGQVGAEALLAGADRHLGAEEVLSDDERGPPVGGTDADLVVGLGEAAEEPGVEDGKGVAALVRLQEHAVERAPPVEELLSVSNGEGELAVGCGEPQAPLGRREGDGVAAVLGVSPLTQGSQGRSRNGAGERLAVEALVLVAGDGDRVLVGRHRVEVGVVGLQPDAVERRDELAPDMADGPGKHAAELVGVDGDGHGCVSSRR
ncbi:hypothetical protein [Streptomyces sp. CB02009]|uniref:hypothetical protein n=1 Tax=Streptomyces sp. CB02009 TaxID=1703938 RepID=UPI001160ECF6|nr:hypothetical protein [Streptomyces sp. CB02009]